VGIEGNKKSRSATLRTCEYRLSPSFLITSAFLLHAQQQNEGDSPSGKIHFVVRGDEEKKIYLSPAGASSQEVELCETPGWGNLVIHFSPDDDWIVVQDGGPSAVYP
jgi:hypothetical protein